LLMMNPYIYWLTDSIVMNLGSSWKSHDWS
jgi:hypothetical protein